MRWYLSLILLLTGLFSQAAEFYVDPSYTGSTQNGSISAPWKTLADLQNNLSRVNPGDFVYFKRGQTYTGTLNIRRSGTAAAPITFSTYGTSTAMPLFVGYGEFCIQVSYQQYVIIEGLKITDPNMNPADHSIMANIKRAFNIDGSNYITIRNCDISLVGTGFNVMGSYNRIENNIINNLRMIRNTPTSTNSDDDYGAMAMVITGSYNEVYRNQFYECWANSYDYQFDGGGVEIFGGGSSNNKIMYNTAKNCNGFTEIGSSYGGVSANNVIAYNKLVNCGDLVWLNNSGTYAITVTNLQIYNNVLVETVLQFLRETKMIGMRVYSSASGIVVMKNNIFWLMTGVDVAHPGMFTGNQMVHENNIYNLGPNSLLNFTIHSSERLASSNIFSSTTHTDPLNWNFRLPSGSPAINFGQNVGISTDFEGMPVPAVPHAGILQSTGSGVVGLTASASAGTISCNGGTTTVTVTATGGTSPYTGTGTFTVGAGTHTYTVRDATNAASTTTITVGQPAALTANVSHGNITTVGGVTTLSIAASGGTSPYTYSLNNGSYQSSNSFSNVSTGTHIARVKDSKGCITSRNVTINVTAVTPLSVSVVAGTIACKSGSTTVTVSATGGTPPYSGTGTFTVTAGTYSYTVRDAGGASDTRTVTVTQPFAVSTSLSAGTIQTRGGTTSITVTASGGSGVYTYKLGTGAYQSSNVFTGIPAGTYQVTAKDSRDCSSTKSITITEPPLPFSLNLSSRTHLSCRNKNDGRIVVAGQNGYPPYQYRRNGFSYSSSNTFSNLAPGTYSITGRDSMGFTSSISVTINNSTANCVTGRSLNSNDDSEYSGMVDVQPVVAVFPNPSNDFFKVITDGNIAEVASILVTDMNGRVVYENRSLKTPNLQIGENWLPGVYLFRMIRGKNVYHHKLIKTSR